MLTITRFAFYDETALGRHQRNFAHENFFLFDGAVGFFEMEGDVQRRAVGQALTKGLEPIQLGFANLIGGEIQNTLPIVRFNGKHFLEDSLEADIFAAARRHVGLQKFDVGIRLQLDEIGRGNDLFDFAEIDAVCVSLGHGV